MLLYHLPRYEYVLRAFYMTPNRLFVYLSAPVAFILISYRFFDLPVAEFFYLHQTFWIVQIASLLTYAGEGIYYLVPSLIAFAALRKHSQEYAAIALFIFTTTAVSGIAVNIIKIIFARFRPKMYFSEHLYGFHWFDIAPASYSFPSGHAVTAVGAGVAFALLFPKYRIAFILGGIFIALTRVLLTAHYLSDVVAGCVLGALVTLMVHYAFVRNNLLQKVPS